MGSPALNGYDKEVFMMIWEKIKSGLCVFLALLCALSTPLSAEADRGALELRIPCRVGESACAVMPDGSTVPLGTVRRLPSRVLLLPVPKMTGT